MFRLFLNRVNTNGARKVNPNIKINTNILSDPTAPSHIQVVYRKWTLFCSKKYLILTGECCIGDGQKLAFEADKMKISNILQVVNKHAKKLEEIEQAKSW